VLSSFFISCKKGENDPAISFRTRKARAVGEWRMKSGYASINIEQKGSAPFNQAHQFDGTTSTINETESGNIAYIYKAAYLLTVKIKKDGTFEMNENFGGKNLVASGTWNFTHGVGKDLKNKEEILFKVNRQSSGYLDGHIFNKMSSEFTYKITQLKNKEMMIETGGTPFTGKDGWLINIEARYTLIQ
jgi:hypothetical protein